MKGLPSMVGNRRAQLSERLQGPSRKGSTKGQRWGWALEPVRKGWALSQGRHHSFHICFLRWVLSTRLAPVVEAAEEFWTWVLA